MIQLIPRRNIFASTVICAAALIVACTSSDNVKTVDIVTGVPWASAESHSYELKQDGDVKGTTTLTVATAASGTFELTQSTKDDKGNSDESVINADSQTLKPISAMRTITDSDTKTLLEVSYEDVDKGTCSSAKVARIRQSTYQPPDETTPDSSRSNPLCVPEHSYDNDESLFIWRTIDFAQDSQVTYTTITANRRDTHLVTLTVKAREEVTVPAGTFDTWRVEVASERSRQSAWFATTPDHTLVQYANNQGQSFRLLGDSR